MWDFKALVTLQKFPHAVHHDHADTRQWSLPGYPSTAEGTDCTKNTCIHSIITYVHTDIILFYKTERKKIFSPNENTENEMTTAADAKASDLIKIISSAI